MNTSFKAQAPVKAPAKVVTYIQTVFNFSAQRSRKIADALVTLSKEKVVVTTAIDSFLDYAKTAKDQEYADSRAANSVIALRPLLEFIAKNKTFEGTVAAIKKFKFKAPKAKSRKSVPKPPVSKPTSKLPERVKPQKAKTGKVLYMAYNHNGNELMKEPASKAVADKEARLYRQVTDNASYVEVYEAKV